MACGWKHCAGITGAGNLFCWGWGGSQGSSTAFAPMKSAGKPLALVSPCGPLKSNLNDTTLLIYVKLDVFEKEGPASAVSSGSLQGISDPRKSNASPNARLVCL